jgi:hypothetical protein
VFLVCSFNLNKTQFVISILLVHPQRLRLSIWCCGQKDTKNQIIPIFISTNGVLLTLTVTAFKVVGFDMQIIYSE